jgi:hypothetical protein
LISLLVLLCFTIPRGARCQQLPFITTSHRSPFHSQMFQVFSRSQVSPLRRTAVAPCRPTMDRATESRELLTVISPSKKNSFQISSLRFYAQAVSCHGLSHHVLQKGRPHSKAPTPPFHPRRLDSLDATHHDIGATSRTVMYSCSLAGQRARIL